jgi:hypothetical protein
MSASFIAFRDARRGFAMRFRIWAKAILLGAPVLGGLTALAQYGAPATPTPYYGDQTGNFRSSEAELPLNCDGTDHCVHP